MTTMTIAVLAGGISHERDISLKTGRRVADALSSRGHNVTLIDPDAHLFTKLHDLKPDVIWPALHGSSGEDGALLDLLTLSHFTYVGPSARSARLAWSKPIAKSIVEKAGISTPVSVAIAREAFRELGAPSILELIGSELGKNLVVKPAWGGSAQGLSLVSSASDLPRAMVEAFTYADVALVEQFVSGPEITVGVYGSDDAAQTLPAVEIVPEGGVYSFEARYVAGETTFFVPPRLEASVEKAVREAALVAHRELGLSGLSRIDFIVDASGTPWFLEANSLPGLTETSSIPLAIESLGIELGEFYERLVISAIQ